MTSIELTAEHRRLLLEIARQTIRDKLSRAAERALPQGADDPALRQPAGCFVTLHERGTHRLRGCVGRLDTQLELVAAVQQAAESVLEDPRFYDERVQLHELAALEIELSIILPLRPAANPLDFDPLNEGIYLTVNERGGCFLPQVAQETGWGREQLLDRLISEKLGLPADAWKQPSAKLMKFSTITVGPEPFDEISHV